MFAERFRFHFLGIVPDSFVYYVTLFVFFIIVYSYIYP